MPYARKIGTYKGKPVFRVPVKIVCNNSRGSVAEWIAPSTLVTEFVSQSPKDAANHVIDLMAATPETEVYAYGPKGGETYRYNGWESSIFRQMMQPRGNYAEQLSLFPGRI